jgi:hypothetical protein
MEQAIVLPDGLVASMWGPYPGVEINPTLLDSLESTISTRLESLLPRGMYIFGNTGAAPLPVSTRCLPPAAASTCACAFPGYAGTDFIMTQCEVPEEGPDRDALLEYNQRMQKIREYVDWYGDTFSCRPRGHAANPA